MITERLIKLLERVHAGFVENRRLHKLSSHLSRLIPPECTVLDVGCGDGSLAEMLGHNRKDLSIIGTETLLWQSPKASTILFDGLSLPFGDRTFDVVMFVDVLHHAEEPTILLQEAKRIARRGIVVKDHVLQGKFSEVTLRFMDWLGNARYGVTLPYTYWPRTRWEECFSTLGLRGDWLRSLDLYPWPFSWLFDRQLHFLVYLESQPENSDTVDRVQMDIVSAWEDAYLRFETPEEETRKFKRRLQRFGCAQWAAEAEIVDLFCGRGSGLHALTNLGFRRVTGVDIAPALARKYSGPGEVIVADCRKLPIKDRSKDIVVIHGGLHHLVDLPADLRQTLAEVHRVLRNSGRIFVVEPWHTPFLRFVHFVCRIRLARILSSKIDALATMIDHEAPTYLSWLASGQAISEEFEKLFILEHTSTAWGKLRLQGRLRNID